MAIGVGLDTIFVSSSTLPSKHSLGSRKVESACSGQQFFSYNFQSSSGCFLSPSLLHLSHPGCRLSIVARAGNSSCSRFPIGRLASAISSRHLQRNSFFVGEENCSSCSGESVRISGQRDRDLISRYKRACQLSVENNPRENGNSSGACARRRCQGRSGRSLTVAQCEAEGGGTSYEDRIATVESSSGTTECADRYVGGDPKVEGESPERASDSDTSLITTGSSEKDTFQDPSDLLSITDARGEAGDGDGQESAIDVLKEILRVAQEDLESCRRNSEKMEEIAQRIAEKAIALKDEAAEAENLTNVAISKVEDLLGDELSVQEELSKATSAKAAAEDLLKTAEAALEQAVTKAKDVTKSDGQDMEKESEKQELVEAKVELTTERTVDITVKPVDGDVCADPDLVMDRETTVAKTEVMVEGLNSEAAIETASVIIEETEALDNARSFLRDSWAVLERIEAELSRVQGEKAQLQHEVQRLREAADRAKESALVADECVANAMAEAEQAVAMELEAAQWVGDAEFALHKAESYAVDAAQQAATFAAIEAEKLAVSVGKTVEEIEEELEQRLSEVELDRLAEERIDDGKVQQISEGVLARVDIGLDKGLADEVKSGPPLSDLAALTERTSKESDPETKKTEPEKKAELVKDPPVLKSPKKRSSRFFSASYFSSEDGEEFSPAKAYAHFSTSMKPQLVKIVIGLALLFAGGAYVNNRLEKPALLPQPLAYSTSIEQVNASTKPIVRQFKNITKRVMSLLNNLAPQGVNEEEASLFDVLWLLLASVIFVPLFMKIPGGSPVLGYLVAGVLIGPHTIHIVQNVHGTKAIAEFGVVFLLFNIGLELSVERLSSMKKYVFGLGTVQVIATAVVVGVFLNFVAKISGPAAIIIASGLALSSTAVVLQVLQERGESTSRHGRATFSVLLFQDLAVVVLLILIPLLSAKGGVGLQEIGSALGVAGIKAVVAIVGIIASGRLFLRPIYKQMADNHNAEIFAANTLLVVLGTSVLTARAGLSMALGAFLAGLLLAETEFALQVESDIAPYRGLLLGLFFMTVGMSIDPKLFVAKFPEIISSLGLLIVGKTLLVASVGRLFGLSTIAAVRTGLLLAPGGEFAFVAFGEAVNQGILSPQLSSLLFLVVGLSMALTPWLAAGGQVIAARFEQQDVRSLLPQENETDDLQGHIIICGFGRVGQIIAQLLSERLIPFVALDVRSDRVSAGRQLDLPVYFGDAGSKEVLHKIGAERAAAAVITLDTPGANYRTVWALSKHFPGVKTFVRAHDVDHGINLEKAGATAVVPETLEPSLQLAAAVLAQAKVPAYEIASAIDDFRSRHLSELTELSETSGTSLGYGFSRVMTKPLLEVLKLKTDDEVGIERRVEGNIVAVP